MLERCVLVNDVSEDLRAAGLRAANVFMARSAKANERDAIAAGGEAMHSKGDHCCFFLVRGRYETFVSSQVVLFRPTLLTPCLSAAAV